MKIQNITSKEILDSKEVPTLETTVTLDDGSVGVASVPSGSSTGTHEAHELRDGDPNRYQGKGVLIAVKNINETINHHLVNKTFSDQKTLDEALIALDGTEDKSGLGANTLLSVSMAYCRAVSQQKNIQLYQYIQEISGQKELTPIQMNILVMEGGKHGEWATDIQEYMVIPKKEKYPSVTEALNVGKNILESVRNILSDKIYDTNLGMEGGYAPKELKSNEESLQIITQAIEKAGYRLQEDILIGIDFASSEFFENGNYLLKRENKSLNREEWIQYIDQLTSKYPIYFLEDLLSQDDWEGWTKITALLGQDKLIVGDDLITTNVDRIRKAVEEKAINATIIKPNQIGTVSETIDAIALAEQSSIPTIISHRGGETEDSFIADLVAGTQSSQTKFGGTTQKERLAKYDRLVQIYEG